jgi:regulator of replication initiation timing
VVDLTLEEFQRNQSIRISRDIIGQSEEHEQKMQTNAQKSWENAHKQLVALLRFLDQDYDESCEKATRPLESFSDDDLAYLIHVRLRAMQGDASKKAKPNEIIEVKRSLQELSQKYAGLEQENADLLEKNKQVQAENTNLNSHLSALRQAQRNVLTHDEENIRAVASSLTVPDNSTSHPDWIAVWRSSKAFEKTSTAILVMGETGKALRPSITKEMARRLSLSIDNGGLDEAINKLLSTEEGSHPILIERIKAIPEQGSSSGGNNPDILRLIDDGKIAFQTLSGQIPKENEYDHLIRHHSSPEHTILNVQTAEILAEVGYLIKAQAQEIQLPNGSTFVPDIVAVDRSSGELIFIEVEHDVNKGQTARKLKWMNLYEASNGNLYVFCDNLTCQRAVQGEINLALGGLTYNSFLTNLHGIRSGKRSENGSIWLSIKRMK